MIDRLDRLEARKRLESAGRTFFMIYSNEILYLIE